MIPNPFFGKRDRPFSHPEFPIYLVTRLAAYDFDGVKGMIERSLAASNRGKFVLDLRGPDDEPGNDWLRDAAILLPKDRVVLEESIQPVWDQTDVIGYASWGSNDRHHDRRFPGFHWLPGGIVTEYVSTDGRTFEKPPEKWVPSQQWNTPSAWFAGTPQSMLADYILEGATGGSGPRVRTVSDHDTPAGPAVARLLQRPQSGGELLSGDPRAELAEHRGGRSAVFVGKPGTLVP